MNKLLIAFLGGVVTGILIATTTGPESRKQLGEAWNEFKDSLAKGVKDLYAEGEKEHTMSIP
ncbi:MAG: hypothetical protein NVSMB7_14570 [Chitinophagaceae bacterium]